jgi:hypothetical protein
VAILALLLGAVLGRFFKVFVLVPLILATALIISIDIDVEYAVLRSLLEFGVLVISLQIGYVFGLLSFPRTSHAKLNC